MRGLHLIYVHILLNCVLFFQRRQFSRYCGSCYYGGVFCFTYLFRSGFCLYMFWFFKLIVTLDLYWYIDLYSSWVQLFVEFVAYIFEVPSFVLCGRFLFVKTT